MISAYHPEVRGLLPAPLPPLRKHIVAYLDYKAIRTTDATQRGYRSILNTFERFYPTHELAMFEPPTGTLLVEDFLTNKWGRSASRTYNKGLYLLSDFFKWLQRRGHLNGDPTENVDPATRPTTYERTTFSDAECAAILAANHGVREQIALRLLLFYGIRKGGMRNIRLGDFDEHSLQVTFLTKGQKFQTLHIPDADPIWDLLATLDGEPNGHYLIPRQQQRRRRPPHRREFIAAAWQLGQLQDLVASIDDSPCETETRQALLAIEDARLALERAADSASVQVKRFPGEQISDHGAHDWWYRILGRAGVVEKGTTSGRHLHSARHTAAQRVLDRTGNMRAVQTLLGHSNAAITEAYVGVNEDGFREQMAGALGLDDDLRRRARS